MALLSVADAYPGALSGWASVKAQDGSTAADLASMTGGENINISMVHKLAGNSPDESAFHFHPETGELLEDDEAEMASDTAQDIPGSEGSKVTQSQPGHHLPTITHATPTVQVDTASVAEEPSSPNLKPWSSTGADNLEVESKVHEYAGLHYRSKGFTSHRSMYEEDMFLERKGQCLKAPPSMFDSQAAVLSSVVIGIVACLALGLRYCLD